MGEKVGREGEESGRQERRGRREGGREEESEKLRHTDWQGWPTMCNFTSIVRTSTYHVRVYLDCLLVALNRS